MSRRARWTVRIVVLFVLVGLPVLGGCYMIRMPGRSHRGPLPPLSDEQSALRDELRRDLEHLSVTIGERNVFRHEQLQESADWIEASLADAGLATSRQAYRVVGTEVENVVGELAGGAAADEIVVIGAHYDSVFGCPAANDNGTGVVATLALARAFRGTRPERTLRFVLFVNEEPPYFQSEDMGSLVYAKGCRERSENVVAMLSLETIGCYSNEKGSQHYPVPLGFIYPTTANFILFVGNVRSRGLVRESVASFRRNAAFPSEGAAVPEFVTGVGWSDHWAFWQAGYPALMVTDTALFRYEHYHEPTDTIDRIDFDGFTRVVDGLRYVTADLARLALPELPRDE